ncbi:hypothetical protein A3F37_00345 [Candidatus Saccharibacteria bacterium RIFCSPHIGHO2_12_FULL_41_12]|nr:MAG: hypothetical protein A3F37_00345 [Candidatus Saccharibacteria bacterium RIFCSPHIGHO2_12_FULL_41_12]
MKVGIQGEKYSWHYIAAKRLFSADCKVLFYKEFNEVFRAQDAGAIDYGLVAIENSVYGSINAVYQELSKGDYFICGEIKQQINQCLLALPTTKLTEITDVYSHPVALNQCHQWLEKNLPHVDQHAYFDTAMSANKVAQSKRKLAAIGAKELTEELNLTVLAENIDIDSNYTRFIAFSKSNKVSDKADKTSIILTTAHVEGAIYAALGCFANANINLSKLESHPIPGIPWEYQFYIDLDCRFDSKKFIQAAKCLLEQNVKTKVIGCYKADDMV